MRTLFFCAIFLFAVSSQAVSLSLDTNITAPELTAQQSEGGYSGLQLLIVNEDLVAIQIASAQFSVGILAGAGAEGAVSVAAVSASPSPLFASPPMPIGPPGQFSTFTLSGFPAGPTLGAETSGGLATIDLGWLPDTSGIFELVARPLAVGSPLTSSHWVDQSMGFVSQPYSNTELSATGEILLATLTIVSIPEPATTLLFWGAVAIGMATYRQTHHLKTNSGVRYHFDNGDLLYYRE